jgi:hypothetical protein
VPPKRLATLRFDRKALPVRAAMAKQAYTSHMPLMSWGCTNMSPPSMTAGHSQKGTCFGMTMLPAKASAIQGAKFASVSCRSNCNLAMRQAIAKAAMLMGSQSERVWFMGLGSV